MHFGGVEVDVTQIPDVAVLSKGGAGATKGIPGLRDVMGPAFQTSSAVASGCFAARLSRWRDPDAALTGLTTRPDEAVGPDTLT